MSGSLKHAAPHPHTIVHPCPRDELLNWWDHLPGGTKFKEYFDSTSLHGFKYFSESGRSLSERYYWIIALVLVQVASLVAVYDQTAAFFNAPVLMSLDSTATPIWEIPFPAITICSENQVRPSFFNVVDHIGKANLTPTKEEILSYLEITCKINTSSAKKKEFLDPEVMDNIHNAIWDTCNQTYFFNWMSKIWVETCSILQPVLTSMGACHTFNSLPSDLLYRSSVYNLLHGHSHRIKSNDEGEIWSPDNGYKGKNFHKSPPWRTAGGGYGRDASFIVNLNSSDFDQTCHFGGHGFLVILHSPAELPSLSHPTTYVHTDQMTSIKVIPEIKITDKDLRRWPPEQRGCFFQDERPLRYFQFYTEKNCDMECESNVSLTICGCVPFFHPRTKEIPICGPDKEKCYIESIINSLDPDTPSADDCNCMPSCFEIEFRINVMTFQRNYSIASMKGFYKDRFEVIPEGNFAIITAQYQTQKVTAMKRIAVFGLSDFIANIGGLLGLFLGFSFLSLFEIFYFCTLRFKKNKNRQRKINVSKDLENDNII